MKIDAPLPDQSLRDYKKWLLAANPCLLEFIETADDQFVDQGTLHYEAEELHEILEKIVPDAKLERQHLELRRSLLDEVSRNLAAKPGAFVTFDPVYFSASMLEERQFWSDEIFFAIEYVSSEGTVRAKQYSRELGMFGRHKIVAAKYSARLSLDALPTELLVVILRRLNERAQPKKED